VGARCGRGTEKVLRPGAVGGAVAPVEGADERPNWHQAHRLDMYEPNRVLSAC
jgi:hypothetical protein